MTTSAPLIRNAALRRLLIWGGLIFALALFIFLFNGILLPFVLGALIAYLLNPLIEPLEGIGAPRWLSAIGILVLFFSLAGIGILAIAPIIAREITELANNAPLYLNKLEILIRPYLEKISPYIGTINEETLTKGLKDNAQNALNFSGIFFSKILAGTNMMIGFITTLFLTPIVAFYMMAEWPQLTKRVKALIPNATRATTLNLLGKMDRSLAGFIRGQLSVCVVLGLIYGIALIMIGLKFGFLIGLLSGLLSFIPFVGSAFGLVVSVGVAFFQFGTPEMVSLTLAVFIVGQMFEGNILTPKLVGESIELHPLWIIFAVMGGGSLMGFTGMLIALPVAAISGVMVRFAVDHYKKSAFFMHEDKPTASQKKTEKQAPKSSAPSGKT